MFDSSDERLGGGRVAARQPGGFETLSTAAAVWSTMRDAGFRYAAGALAVAVAAIHILWGFPRLVTQLQAGVIPDPRPAVFVLSGALIFVGIAQIMDGRDPKPIYLAGIGLMFAYIGGYVAWHTVLAHGGFWPWGPEPITYDEPVYVVIPAHLRVETLALVSKVAELLLIGLLAVLYRQDGESTDDRIEAVVGEVS